MLKIDPMRLISIHGQESNYTTWRLGQPQVDDFSALLRSE
jgi:hypothetical protein